MAIKGLALHSVRDFQSKHDPDKGREDATTFELGTLDSRVHGHLKDRATRMMIDPNREVDSEVETTIEQHEVYYQVCQFGIRGWRNLMDSEGIPLEYKTMKRNLGGKSYEVVSDQSLRQIPTAVLVDIAREIMKQNDLTDLEGND